MPDFSPQRRKALLKANSHRVGRAELKKQLKVGRVSLADVLLKNEIPEWLYTMHVLDLVLALPKVGRVTAMKVLKKVRVSPSRAVGDLTLLERSEIVSLIRH